MLENYFNEYYYYNQTYYGDNETEPDYSKPLEKIEHYNFDYYDCIIRKFNLSSNYAYWFYYNESRQFQLSFFVCRSIFLEQIIDLNGTLECYQFLRQVDVEEKSYVNPVNSHFFIPPFLDEWLFVYIDTDDSVIVNITLTDEILKI